MNLEAVVSRILAQTTDNMLHLTAKDMGIKTILETSANALTLTLRAGFPSHFLQDALKPALMQALAQALPEYQSKIVLEHFIQAHRTQLVGKGLRNIKNTIAIASGKGGVGKSTVTVNLATALARAGARVGILDADIYGPSIPLMLGRSQPIEFRDEQYIPANAHGIQAMSIGYLTEGQPALIWRGPMLAKSLLQMINMTQWDNLDYLFIDLPPGTGDIQLSLVQKIPLTAAVIVTTPQTVATLDAEKALRMFQKTNIDVLGVIENMSSYRCQHCGEEDAIFSAGGAEQVCQTYNTPLLGTLPLHSQITRHCEEGNPSAAHAINDINTPFIKTALKTAQALSQRPLNYTDVFPKVVVE